MYQWTYVILNSGLTQMMSACKYNMHNQSSKQAAWVALLIMHKIFTCQHDEGHRAEFKMAATDDDANKQTEHKQKGTQQQGKQLLSFSRGVCKHPLHSHH